MRNGILYVCYVHLTQPNRKAKRDILTEIPIVFHAQQRTQNATTNNLNAIYFVEIPNAQLLISF